jgi:hypothetical protein
MTPPQPPPPPPSVATTPPPRRIAAFPNLAGEWMPRDPARTDALFAAGLTDVPGRGALVISQDAATLTVQRTGPASEMRARDAIGGAVPARTVYDLTGRATSHASTTGPVVSRTHWEGNRLIVTTTLQTGELETSYTIVGGDLQVETTVRREDGRPASTIRLWYQKAK